MPGRDSSPGRSGPLLGRKGKILVGVVPDVITYSAVISACEKGKQYERALELFEERLKGEREEQGTERVTLLDA